MTAIILDGKKVSSSLRQAVSEEVKLLSSKNGINTKLTVIIVGDDAASKVYVKNKRLACEQTGILSQVIEMPGKTTENELISQITKLNNDPSVHGILVQLPVPKHINEEKIINLIDPSKDVDAFHPFNVGNILAGKSVFEPCTPGGIIELLKFYNIKTAGKHAVIVGRSNIVGKPLAAMLLQKGEFADATVTVCHSKTDDLKKVTLTADILIAAIGRAEFIKGDMIRDGAVVIDVGMNRIEDSSAEKGSRLVGDVKYEEAYLKASYITPVPGGVGPMTIAMLLKNTLRAAKLSKKSCCHE